MAYNQQHYPPPPGGPPPAQYQQGGHPGQQGGYPGQQGGYSTQQSGYNPQPAQGYNAPHGQHAPQGAHVGGFAPPSEDSQLFGYFSAVDQDRSGTISVTELQRALVNGNFTEFDLDTVQMLMSIFDTGHRGPDGRPIPGSPPDGTIDFQEFQGLWKYIQDWQRVFRLSDGDGSGHIDSRELAQALKGFGYNLSPPLLTLVERKYAVPSKIKNHAPEGITFDRFVRACVVVKQATELFQRLDTDRDGWIQIAYEGFMDAVLRLP
ncbi:hypothetical protein DFH06DRAFT_1246582 [Mycena polygramma]|nr:hypothetical protein DFH06DRAFT_1246582 [Mycena polygramma]